MWSYALLPSLFFLCLDSVILHYYSSTVFHFFFSLSLHSMYSLLFSQLFTPKISHNARITVGLNEKANHPTITATTIDNMIFGFNLSVSFWFCCCWCRLLLIVAVVVGFFSFHSDFIRIRFTLKCSCFVFFLSSIYLFVRMFRSLFLSNFFFSVITFDWTMIDGTAFLFR